MNTHIPKKIHLCWKDKNVLNIDHPLIENGIRNLQKLNPSWKIEVSDDSDVDEYLETRAPIEYNILKDSHIVHKIDFWRLVKIYNEGGLYIDIDRFCNVEIDLYLEENTRWVLPVCKELDFSQDIILSAPNNPAIFNALTLFISRKIDSRITGFNENNIYYFGAPTYMHSLTHTLFGEMINPNPGTEKMKEIINHITKHFPFIQIYQEDPPTHTFLYRDGNLKDKDEWEAMKRDFYGKCQIKHWTGEW